MLKVHGFLWISRSGGVQHQHPRIAQFFHGLKNSYLFEREEFVGKIRIVSEGKTIPTWYVVDAETGKMIENVTAILLKAKVGDHLIAEITVDNLEVEMDLESIDVNWINK